MVSQPFKDLIADGVWARAVAANRETPVRIWASLAPTDTPLPTNK